MRHVTALAVILVVSGSAAMGQGGDPGGDPGGGTGGPPPPPPGPWVRVDVSASANASPVKSEFDFSDNPNDFVVGTFTDNQATLPPFFGGGILKTRGAGSCEVFFNPLDYDTATVHQLARYSQTFPTGVGSGAGTSLARFKYDSASTKLRHELSIVVPPQAQPGPPTPGPLMATADFTMKKGGFVVYTGTIIVAPGIVRVMVTFPDGTWKQKVLPAGGGTVKLPGNTTSVIRPDLFVLGPGLGTLEFDSSMALSGALVTGPVPVSTFEIDHTIKIYN